MTGNGQQLQVKRMLNWKLAVLIFLFGVGLGWELNVLKVAAGMTPFIPIFPARKKYEDGAQAKDFSFISPLLLCDSTEPRKSRRLQGLEKIMNDYVDSQLGANNAASISTYYRDLNPGGWTGVNEDKIYSPASLLKVPTIMAFFKIAELYSDILSKRILFNGSFDENAVEYFKPKNTLRPGHSYTIEELLHAMAAYSDNNATRLLFDNIEEPILDQVYADLGVNVPNNEDADITDFITVKEYARFFRVLYNATYLDETYSNKVLKFLSEPDLPQGLQAGIPSNISIAQKFGERTIITDQTSPVQKELHDCGIVYYPQHPYLLCVMTKGANFDKLADVIQGLSRLTYHWVDGQYKK